MRHLRSKLAALPLALALAIALVGAGGVVPAAAEEIDLQDPNDQAGVELFINKAAPKLMLAA